MYFTRIVISHRLTPGSRCAAISGASSSTWPASQLRPPSLTAMRWTALPAQLAATCRHLYRQARQRSRRERSRADNAGYWASRTGHRDPEAVLGITRYRADRSAGQTLPVAAKLTQPPADHATVDAARAR